MRHRLLLALLVACCLSVPVFGAAPADDYRLGPGDIIVVSVVDHPTFGGTVTVLTDGTVQLPVVNQVAVSGSTLPEAMKILTAAYKKRLLKPEVFITLATPQLARAYVSGAVVKPGVYTLAKNLTSVVDLLMAAGGITRPIENCVAALTHKAGGEKTPIRLAEILAGDRKADVQLIDGDLLSIDARPTVTVFVGGEVETPGLFELPAGATASQALAAAHGIKGAEKDVQAAILRGKTLLPLNLTGIYAQKAETDLALQQGDVLRVDSAKITVEVAGDIRLAATYTPARGLDIMEVLALAGGANGSAQLSTVTVTHANGTKDTVDLSAPPATRKRLEILAGDKIFVPSSLVQVSVTGEVKTPGAYPLSPKVTLQEAITVAGGFTSKALKSLVKVHHLNGTVDTFDLVVNQPISINWQPGDYIIVSPMTEHITVVGNVVTIGTVLFDPLHPCTVSEAVILAGGPKPNTALKHTQILRPSVRDKKGKPAPISVNLEAVITKGDVKKDTLLQPGDVVYVPPARAGFKFADILNALLAARLVGEVL